MKKKIVFFLFFLNFIILINQVRTFAIENSPGTFNDLQILVNNNSEVILDRDYVNSGLEGQIIISGKNITLDLNGHVINANRASGVLNVTNSNLTIKDSGSNIEHKFDANEISLLTLNEESGTAIVKGGCITGGNFYSRSSYGSGVCLDNNSTLKLESGNIIGNTMTEKFQFGAGISARNNSKIVINGGSVSYNILTWEGSGGGIYVNNSELIINNGEISYNNGSYGGGICVDNGGKFLMNGGTIKCNTVGHNGAGIALYNSTAVINDGIIEYNINPATWIGIGGGISTCFGADLTINGGIIRKNQANRGAGIGAWTGGNIKIYGGKIIENISTEDTTPTDCTEKNYGAGIYFDSSDTGYTPCEVVNLTLGKNAIITNNINSVNNMEENVYLANNQKVIIVSDENAPKNDMKVGITMSTPGTFVSNIPKDYSDNFLPDDTASYYIKKDGSDLKLSPREPVNSIELNITIPPHAGEIVKNNLFAVTSENAKVSVKEWRLNGSAEKLPDDYVFIEGKTYIPILKVEIMNSKDLFNENTNLTVHGSTWGNGEGTYSLGAHKTYGYVKELCKDYFLLDEVTIIAKSAPCKIGKYFLKLNETKSDSEKVSNDTDMDAYINSKKQDFINKINEFKNENVNVNEINYESLFTKNSYAVVNDIVLKSTNFNKSDDAIIIGNENTPFKDIKVLNGNLTATYEYDVNYSVITITKEQPTTPKTGDSVIYVAVILIISVAILYVTRKKLKYIKK